MQSITRERAMVLMGSSSIPSRDVLRVCAQQNLMNPIDYFAKAVETEREHGTIGAMLGTDVIGFDDQLAAKIALAHLFGVEYGHPPKEWQPCPYYYHELWSMESRCMLPGGKGKNID